MKPPWKWQNEEKCTGLIEFYLFLLHLDDPVESQDQVLLLGDQPVWGQLQRALIHSLNDCLSCLPIDHFHRHHHYHHLVKTYLVPHFYLWVAIIKSDPRLAADGDFSWKWGRGHLPPFISKFKPGCQVIISHNKKISKSASYWSTSLYLSMADQITVSVFWN